jgi:serine phosphatase RsbU (regulator of sigma subunit)/CHASE3 domain sensor protein
MTVVATITVATGAFTAWQSWSARQTVLHDQHTVTQATVTAETLLTAAVDQETGERGYLLTGETSFLQPFDRGIAATPKLLARLDHELASRPADLTAIAQVKDRYRTWLADVANPEIADVKAGQRSLAVAIERTGSGKQHFDQLRESIADLLSDVTAQSAAAQARADQVLGATFLLAVLWVVLVLLLLAFVLYALRRWVTSPIERLARNVRAVAAGDIDRPVRGQGPPEVAALGDDVERMRRRLRDEADELRQLREALAEHSPLHLLVHSELEPSGEAAPLSVAGRLLPAEGVLAGDWYDVVRSGPDRVAAAVVDISGHGPAAGLFALKVKHLLTPMMRAGVAPGEAVAWAAAECGETEEQYATGLVVEIDSARGICRFANAGHPGGMLFRHARLEKVLATTGPIMCALPGAWATDEVAVHSGDLLVLLTDGVLESRRADGSEFGVRGVQAAVGRLGEEVSPEVVAEEIVSSLRTQCTFPLKDDATVVVLRLGGFEAA